MGFLFWERKRGMGAARNGEKEARTSFSLLKQQKIQMTHRKQKKEKHAVC